MSTFNAYFKKEMMESYRQYRYLVLAVGIMLFAILDPLMLKLLPIIMKNQLPVDLGSLIVATPKSSVLNYIKDLYQFGNIFVVFTIGGLLSDEVKHRKLMFPYSTGSSPAGIVMAKAVHYIMVIALLILLGFYINFYYSSILLTGETVRLRELIVSTVLMIIYFIFTASSALLFSSFVKKGITAGFISLAVSYGTMALSNIEGLGRFMPYKLVQGANAFSMDGMVVTILFTLMLIIGLIAITILRMTKIEVV